MSVVYRTVQLGGDLSAESYRHNGHNGRGPAEDRSTMPAAATKTRRRKDEEVDYDEVDYDEDAEYDQDDEEDDAADTARDQVKSRRSARRFADYGGQASQRAVRAYVRALNDTAVAFIPSIVLRPGMAIRAYLDLWAGLLDFQRAMWDEMTSVWRDDVGAAARRSRRDERVDWDGAWERERDRIGR